MGKPEIIGYVEEWAGPPGFTLGIGDPRPTRFVRRRPLYRPRDFHARARPDGGYVLHCRICDTREEYGPASESRPDPHDAAMIHAKWWHSGRPVLIPAKMSDQRVWWRDVIEYE